MKGNDNNKKIGFVGLGIMGAAMARNLLSAGYALTVYNRSDRRTVNELTSTGAKRAASPADVAADSDVVISIVTDTPDMEQVILGDHGVIHGAKPGATVIDMSTVSPKTTKKVAAILKKHDIDMLDAPVSGGDVGAANGTLSIMVGGDQSIFDKCLPIFESMGKNINLMGSHGAGQATKLCNQIAASIANMAMAEALMLAAASNLDVKKVIDAISGGAGGSWHLSNLGPRIAAGDFEPGFMVYLQQKDLRLVLDAANDVKVALPAVGMVHQLLNIVERNGASEEGTQALIKAYESQLGLQAREPRAV